MWMHVCLCEYEFMWMYVLSEAKEGTWGWSDSQLWATWATSGRTMHSLKNYAFGRSFSSSLIFNRLLAQMLAVWGIYIGLNHLYMMRFSKYWYAVNNFTLLNLFYFCDVFCRLRSIPLIYASALSFSYTTCLRFFSVPFYTSHLKHIVFIGKFRMSSPLL